MEGHRGGGSVGLTWHLLGPADGHDQLAVSQVGHGSAVLDVVVRQGGVLRGKQLVQLGFQRQQRGQDLVVGHWTDTTLTHHTTAWHTASSATIQHTQTL